MPYFKTNGVTISGIAAAVPTTVINAETLTKNFDSAYIQKFIKSTGITCCHQTKDNQTASDLGFAAAEKLLAAKRINRSDVGALIFVTTSPDYRKPTTACVLQKRGNYPQDCACMDIIHGCAGFMYGHQTMQAMMQTSECQYGMLILGETTSKVIDKQEGNAMMFGDAGAAVLYERKKGTENLTLLRSEGNRFRSLIVPSGGFRDLTPANPYFIANDGARHSKFNLYMDGMDVFNFATTEVLNSIKEYLVKIGKSADDFDVFACHQANNYIIQRLAKKLGFPQEKVPICLDRYGNTSSVSIPLLLCDRYGGKEGITDTVLASGFGIGLAWGVTSFEINSDSILPVIETDEYYQEGVIR